MKKTFTPNGRIRLRRENSITVYNADGTETLVLVSAGKEYAAELDGHLVTINSVIGLLSLPLSEVDVLGQ